MDTPLYKHIYHPEGNSGHQIKRIVTENEVLPDGTPVLYKRFVYYEGYGQKTDEKVAFMKSVNEDNSFWRDECPGKAIPLSESGIGKETRFHPVARVRIISPENDTGEESIDAGDRHERVSWNFSNMLASYVEECRVSDRPTFFKGVGEKWAKNGYLMEEMGRIFDWMNDMLTNPDWSIGLAEISVKEYPVVYYREIEKLYRDHMKRADAKKGDVDKGPEISTSNGENKFRFNPSATEFYPLSEYTKPPKPSGDPPYFTRPNGCEDSSAKLAWNLHQLSDQKIWELDKKLQLLINLHGPVVCAEEV